jgi:hypothetical protein
VIALRVLQQIADIVAEIIGLITPGQVSEVRQKMYVDLKLLYEKVSH